MSSPDRQAPSPMGSLSTCAPHGLSLEAAFLGARPRLEMWRTERASPAPRWPGHTPLDPVLRPGLHVDTGGRRWSAYLPQSRSSPGRFCTSCHATTRCHGGCTAGQPRRPSKRRSGEPSLVSPIVTGDPQICLFVPRLSEKTSGETHVALAGRLSRAGGRLAGSFRVRPVSGGSDPLDSQVDATPHDAPGLARRLPLKGHRRDIPGRGNGDHTGTSKCTTVQVGGSPRGNVGRDVCVVLVSGKQSRKG